MKSPMAGGLVLATVAVIVAAALHDFALIAGRALVPWFGWMFP